MADQTSAENQIAETDAASRSNAELGEMGVGREPMLAPSAYDNARPARRPAPPFRFLIPILLVLLVPLMHGTEAGETLFLKSWVLIGLGGAVFGLMVILSGVRLTAGGESDPLGMAAWGLLLAFFLHQFEEFGVDLYGNLNAFPTYMGIVLTEHYPEFDNPLTELSIYRVNTIGVWGLFLLAIWAGHRLPWMGLAAAGIMFANACVHIGLAFAMREYNPGLATAVLLFLPLSLRYFIVSAHVTDASWLAAISGILFGLACHGALPTVLVEASEPAWGPRLALIFGLLVLFPVGANLIARILRRR